MASDSQVQVRIVGTLDSSVRSSFQATQTQVSSLNGASLELGRSMQQEAQAWMQQSHAAGTAAGIMEQTTAKVAQSHGAVSTATREFRALFDELSSGRTRMLPGTLAIIGQRVLGLGPAALASVGGVVALAAGFAYLAIQAKDAEQASEGALARSALANNLISEKGIKTATDRLEQLPHVTAKVAQETVSEFASMRGMTDQIMLSLADGVQNFAQATNQSLPRAAADLREFMEAPAQAGPKFIDTIGASAAQVSKFMAAAKEGNGPALAAGLEIFSQRMDAVDAKAGNLARRMEGVKISTFGALEAGDDFGTNVTAAMGVADDAAKQFGTTVRTTGAHDLTAAMRDASMAAATLPPGLEQIRAKVQAIGAESGRTRTQMVQDQIAYLQAALATAQRTNSSAEDQLQIESMLAEKKVQLAVQTASAQGRLAHQATEDAIREIEAQAAAAQKGSAEQINFLTQAYNKAKSAGTAYAGDAIRIEREISIAKNDAAKQWLSEIADTSAEAVAVTNSSAKQQEEDVKQLYQQKTISAQQEVALLAGIENLRYEGVKRELNDELTIWAGYPDETKKINDQIEAAERAHQANMGNIIRTGGANIAKDYERAWQPVTNGFDTMLNGILSGNQTLTQAIARGAEMMAEDWIRQEIRTLEESIESDQARVEARQIANAQMTASDAAASGQQIAASVKGFGPQIMADAKLAAANTYAAVSEIPVVGPFLAPAAAAAAFTAVAAYDTVASFDVGTNQVPSDMLAMVHAGERIIPAADNADLMAALDSMGGEGGGGGPAGNGDLYLTVQNVNVQTPAGASPQVQGRLVVQAIAREARNGNAQLRAAMKPA